MLDAQSFAFKPVCECGDFEDAHEREGEGPCRICRGSNAPWDKCQGFRLMHYEAPDGSRLCGCSLNPDGHTIIRCESHAGRFA